MLISRKVRKENDFSRRNVLSLPIVDSWEHLSYPSAAHATAPRLPSYCPAHKGRSTSVVHLSSSGKQRSPFSQINRLFLSGGTRGRSPTHPCLLGGSNSINQSFKIVGNGWRKLTPRTRKNKNIQMRIIRCLFICLLYYIYLWLLFPEIGFDTCCPRDLEVRHFTCLVNNFYIGYSECLCLFTLLQLHLQLYNINKHNVTESI